jgi:hypothetical protein
MHAPEACSRFNRRKDFPYEEGTESGLEHGDPIFSVLSVLNLCSDVRPCSRHPLVCAPASL